MIPNSPSLTKTFGIELEFMLINKKKGNIKNSADRIINSLKRELVDSFIKKECTKSWVELISFPHLTPKEVFSRFFMVYKV